MPGSGEVQCASLDVAVLGTLLFNRLALESGGPRSAMAAGRHLVPIAWAICWLLPRRRSRRSDLT